MIQFFFVFTVLEFFSLNWTVKESIGVKTGRRNEEWFDEECSGYTRKEQKEGNHVTEDDKVEQGTLSRI